LKSRIAVTVTDGQGYDLARGAEPGGNRAICWITAQDGCYLGGGQHGVVEDVTAHGLLEFGLFDGVVDQVGAELGS